MSDFDVAQAFSLRSLIPIISNNIATIVSPARYVQVGEEMIYSVSHEEEEPTVQEVLNGLQIEIPTDGLELNVKAYKDMKNHWYMTGNSGQVLQPNAATGLVGRWKADALSGTYDSGDKIDQRDDISGSGNDLLDVGNHIYLAGLIDSADMSGQTNDPGAVTRGNTGYKLYTVAYDKTTVYEYDLSVPYDVNTISYTQSFDFSGININQTEGVSIKLNTSGTKLYFLNDSVDRIFEYDLSISWDISTASYSGVYLDIGNQDFIPEGITFGDDGSKLYFLGRQNARIYQYTLSTPWDLSTASYDSIYFDIQGTFAGGLDINHTGTKIVISDYGDDNIYQYTLSTPWDLSTASYDNSYGGRLYIQPGATPRSPVFGVNDDNLYVVERLTAKIYHYKSDRRPTYGTNIQNGLPAIQFDKDFYQVLGLSNGLNLGTEATMIITRYPQTSVNVALSNSSNFLIRRQSGIFLSEPMDGKNHNFTDNSILQTPQISSLIRDDLSVNAYTDYINLPVSSHEIPNNQSTLFQYVGKPNRINPLEGDIYEVIIYDRTLTREELGDIQTYLREKRGLEN